MKTKVFTLFLLIFSFVAGQEIYASDCLNVRKKWENAKGVKDGDMKCITFALRSVILKEKEGELEIITVGLSEFKVWPGNVKIKIDSKLDGTYADVYSEYYDLDFNGGWYEQKFVIYVRKSEQKAIYDALLKNYTEPRDVLPSVIR